MNSEGVGLAVEALAEVELIYRYVQGVTDIPTNGRIYRYVTMAYLSLRNYNYSIAQRNGAGNMIEQLDKQTQPLPLEQKRGRGRPATGQALSNAERQRRYREAQKAQRNEKQKPDGKEAQLKEALEQVCNRVLELEDMVREKNKAIRKLEAELAQRNEKQAEQNEKMNGVWIVESKRPGSRMWKPCGNPETNLKEARQAVDYMQFKSGSGQGEEWRAIRADGLIYWPLWSKAKAPK